jgi:hypothetical protein
MFPKEHGAYGQLACPLITALAVSDWTWPTLLVAVAAVAGFLAHEPLSILLGRRGARLRRERGSGALRWLVVTGTITAAAGVAALWTAPAAVRWSFLLPLAPAVALGAAVWSDREKTAAGEIVAALAFSFVAVPACLAGGTSVSVALAVGIAFAALSSTSTLAVRVVILKVRGGGDPRQVRVTRWTVLSLTALVVTGLLVAVWDARLPWAVVLATAPGLVVSTVLTVQPPSPAQLRTVGWTLVSTSSFAVITLIAMLPRLP